MENVDVLTREIITHPITIKEKIPPVDAISFTLEYRKLKKSLLNACFSSFCLFDADR